MKSHSRSLACDIGLPVPTRCSAGTQEPPGADPFRPAFPPRCSALSIHTARRTVNRGPPQPSVCFAQLCKFQFPLPRISLTPPLPNPLVPLPTIICLPPHTIGVPHQVQKSVTPESQQVFSVPLMKPDYDSSGSPMKLRISSG